MDLHAKYNLTKIINAAGKYTTLSNTRVTPAAVAAVTASLEHFFAAEELQAAASERIAAFSGTEAGYVTPGAAAGIVLCVAAVMTGCDPYKVAQLPDTSGMKNKIILQKAHAVDFGAPITQMIRLAGGVPVEIGNANGTPAGHLAGAIGSDTAAVLHVVSHNTIRFGCLPLVDAVRTAHQKGVPVIVDAAAQSFMLPAIVAAGADLITCSGNKYLAGTLAGMVCGRQDLIAAVAAQNKGIGRPFKVGREGIFGLLAAMEERQKLDIPAWSRHIADKAAVVCRQLTGLPGVRTETAPDPNGNPFCRARVWVDPAAGHIDAATVCATAAAGNPSVRLRAHHTEEGYFDVDVVDLHDDELAYVIGILKDIFQNAAKHQAGRELQQANLSWLQRIG